MLITDKLGIGIEVDLAEIAELAAKRRQQPRRLSPLRGSCDLGLHPNCGLIPAAILRRRFAAVRRELPTTSFKRRQRETRGNGYYQCEVGIGVEVDLALDIECEPAKEGCSRRRVF